MNCPEQTTELEGAIPVITDYAASDSGRPFATGWTADETDGCSCRGPNPTTCVPHPGSSRVSIFGNEWEGLGVPSCPHVPDPARSAVPVPRHPFARPAQVCVVSGHFLQTIGVSSAAGDNSAGCPVGNGPLRGRARRKTGRGRSSGPGQPRPSTAWPAVWSEDSRPAGG